MGVRGCVGKGLVMLLLSSAPLDAQDSSALQDPLGCGQNEFMQYRIRRHEGAAEKIREEAQREFAFAEKWGIWTRYMQAHCLYLAANDKKNAQEAAKRYLEGMGPP